MKIPREEIEIHLKELCSAALVSCPYKEAGCKHKVKFIFFKMAAAAATTAAAAAAVVKRC